VLTPEQRSELDEMGVARIPRAVDRSDALRMGELVWKQLEEQRISRDDPSTWKLVKSKYVKALYSAGRFDAMATPVVRAILDERLGAGRWAEPGHWGQLLVTFPTPGPWCLPHKVWHLDMPAPGRFGIRVGLQLFLMLDEVVAGGGGTLVAGGVHRLVERIQSEAEPGWKGASAEVRDALRRRVPWLDELAKPGPAEERRARFMEQTAAVEGVSLRVIEMTGEPGDVWLMHPWMLHAPAPNCADRPRLMLTERIRLA